MKRVALITAVLIMAAICRPAAVSGQEQAQPFWPALTADELAVAPSPEAATLPPVRQAEVDLSTGTATLSYPLLEWSVGAYPVRIGLTYRVGAFTTDELPGWIALGWNLTGAGSVSRTIMGLPDEMRRFELRNTTQANGADCAEYIGRLMDFASDASFDRYRYSCPGASGQFIVRDGEIIQLPRSNNRIEFIGDINDGVRDFRITTPDGTAYEFTEREYIVFQDCGMIDELYHNHDYTAVSSWMLSRVILPEGSDTIRYEYARMPSWERSTGAFTTSVGISVVLSKSEWMTQKPSIAESTQRTVFQSPAILRHIVSRTASVDLMFDSITADSKHVQPTMWIKGLTLRDADGTEIRHIAMTYNNERRRKLLSIRTTSPGGDIIDCADYHYHPDNAHRIGDMFNYPNTSAVADVTDLASVIDISNGKLNPRRDFNFTYAVAGAMDYSVSATGIETRYEYEPRCPVTQPRSRIKGFKPVVNDTIITDIVDPQNPFDPDDPVNPDPGNDGYDPLAPYTGEFIPGNIPVGIRIKSITDRDIATGRTCVRSYSYSEGIYNVDLSKVKHSDYIALSGKRVRDFGMSLAEVAYYSTVSTALSGCRMPGQSIENTSVFYGEVTEEISGTGISVPIKTVYRFDTSRCPLLFTMATRRMPEEDDYESRSLAFRMTPGGMPPFYGRMVGTNTVGGYFREHIGAAPELAETVSYEFRDGEYHVLSRQRRFYSTVDSIVIQTDLFHEPLVRRYYHQTRVVTRDIRNCYDVNTFQIDTEASARLLDSVATVRFFPDGSSRIKNQSYRYTGPGYILSDSIVPETGITTGRPLRPGADKPIIVLRDKSVFTGDSISYVSALRLPVGETVREGGHIMEHHTAYSCMVSGGGFSQQAASRGLQTLPVREMWVMDGCDTLHRRYDYALFAGAGATSLTRPVAVTTTLSGAARPVDVQRVLSYSPYGRPLSVSQTGRPVTDYEWGYGGDLLTAATIRGSGGSVALRSEFDWQPLVGCTEIRLPSGKTTSYSYKTGRLHSVSDGSGQRLSEYDYELHADTEGTFVGRNRISATAYLIDSGDGAVSTRLFDGSALPVAEIAEGAGADGADVATLTRYDALGRPVARWMPMALDQDAVAAAMKRDTPLQQAARDQFFDETAFTHITYPSRPGTTPASSSLGGADFAGHPQLTELTCSNPADPARRVVRWRWDGASLQADGFYAAGELDAVMTEDGDGRRTWVFTDCLGRQVLSRSATDTPGHYADTYTVCDPWGNPLLVLPPEASRLLGSSGSLTLGASAVADLIDKYAYVYRYDTRLRLRSKKLPGCEPVMYAYDRENRLIFTRDGNQAQSGRRSFLLYDRLGRVALTGTCRDALSDDFWTTDDADLAATSFDSSDATSDLQLLSAADQQNYAEAQLLTSTYYDDYNFLTDAQQSRLAAMRPAGALTVPKGLPTGALTAVFSPADTIAPMLTVSYYDAEERVIATATISHRGDLIATNTTYTRGGLPITTETKLSADTATHTLAATSTYDSQGRMLTTQLSRDGAPAVTIASNTYDRLGRLQSTAYHGGMRRTYAYDMHGWLTGWHCGFLGQQLLYAGGTEPSYTGRVSSKTTNSYGHFDRYDYSYDRLGRLTSAAFSRRMPQGSKPENGDPEADFSTAYSYDLQGNILSLTRQGLIAPGVYGQIDDITATFSGNQLLTLRDDAPTVLLEASLDLPEGAWSGSDFAYDANGNQIRDMSRGVSDVTYNVLNLPQRVEFADGGRIDYLYSASGTKLAETVYDAAGTLISRRDYIGQFEFVADTLERTLLPEGFVTAGDNVFHAYIPDYQGNIVGVYNSSTNTLEQFTDYYPYGLPHASATSPTVNRRKYGAKELTADLGLNLYDFAARFQNPAFPAFTTPDPLAESYYPTSPYVYCGGDPINLIDPSGMKWKNEKDKQYMLDILNSRLNWLNKEIEKATRQKEQNTAKNKPTDKQDKQIEDLNSQIEQVNQAISDVNTLDEDPNNTYALMEIDGNGAHSVINEGGVIYLQYSDEAFIFHEMAHVRQALHNGKMDFDGKMMKTPGKNLYEACRFEVEAHRIQYSINPHSLLKPARNILDIDIEYLSTFSINGFYKFEYAIPIYNQLKNYYREYRIWDEARFYKCKPH